MLNLKIVGIPICNGVVCHIYSRTESNECNYSLISYITKCNLLFINPSLPVKSY